jgi:hypothetical protein
MYLYGLRLAVAVHDGPGAVIDAATPSFCGGERDV